MQKNNNKQFFFLLFFISLIVFLYTNDGHRFTFDEDVGNQEAFRIATMTPDPAFVDGESRLFFEYPALFPPETNPRSICNIGILCSAAEIGHSVTQVPFIFLNHNLNIFSNSNIFESDDFNDINYVFWRNNLNPDFVFLELFYGPIFSALSVSVFFLICRTFSLHLKTSIMLSFIYAFSTLTWAYSQTSLNSVPLMFFLLTGVFYSLKFSENKKILHLFFSSLSLSFAYLVRPDAILVIMPTFVLMISLLIFQNKKIIKFFSFTVPLISVYVLKQFLTLIRFKDNSSRNILDPGIPQVSSSIQNEISSNILGLLFSPGVGLFVFVPILTTAFISFVDFYQKNKKFCILFIIITISFVLFYSRLEYWHGLVSWGPRYLLPVVPFLLIPLGFTLEKRKNIILRIIILFLILLGVFFNFVSVIQDVQWFIWGTFGEENGLYALARQPNGNVYPLWINPVVLFTFEYSQLTHATIWSFANLQHDIFLAELFGYPIYATSFSILLSVPLFLLLRKIKQP